MCLRTVYPYNTHCTCVCPCGYTSCTPATLTAPVSVHVSTHHVPYNTHCICVCPCVYTPCTLQHSLHLCLSMCLHTMYLYNTHCTCVCPCVYTPCTPATLATPVSVHVTTHRVPSAYTAPTHVTTHRVPYNTHCTCVCPCQCLHIVYLYNTHYTCVCPCFYTPCTSTTLATPVSAHVSTYRVPLQHSLHLCLSNVLHTVYPYNTHCTCPCDYTPCTPATLTTPVSVHVTTHRVLYNTHCTCPCVYTPCTGPCNAHCTDLALSMCLHTVYPYNVP